MRLRSSILGSVSLLVLAAATPAIAQTASDAQNSPAGATPAAAQDAAATDGQAQTDNAALAEGEVVVTGLRRSLQSARNIKRNSDQQVDSIVAADIGKLPDVAISDVAARIPGVQVERGGGEASRVLVRGLPDFTTTYNGREIFTAESRSVALQDFPAGGIAAVEVFKTTTADLVEGGLAGEVNVRSRKPFDFDGFEVAGSLWGQHEKRSGKEDPNGNLLITDRWDTSVGEIGALVNFSYTRLRYLDSTRSNTDFIAGNVGGTGANFPDIQRVGYGQGDRERPSVNGALQWRPTTGVELYAEALWQGFRNKVSDRELSVPLWGGSNYANVVANSDGQGESVTVTNPFRPDGFQGATYGKTDTYQYAVGGKYDGGPLKLSVDLAHTKSRFLNSVYSFDTAFASPQTVTADTGLNGLKNGPAVSFANGTDLTDPASFIYRGFFDRQLIARGKDWQGRFDASYDTGISFLTKIEGGFRYVDRDAHFEDGSRYNSREGDRLPLSAIPVDYSVSRTGFPDSDPTGIRGYYTPTYSSIRSNIEQLRAFSGFATGAPPADPALTYTANEKSQAGYGQLKYAFGSGIRVDGALGLRVVHTKLTSNGTSATDTGSGIVYTPVNVSTSYTDWLPNASARVRFTDQLQLRLSASKTRSRPTFADYNPALSLGAPPTCSIPGTPDYQNPSAPGFEPSRCIFFGTSGNADLKPLKSTNYDASLEYYFSPTGSAAIAVFQRDLNGFISRYSTDIISSAGYTQRITTPYNTGKGKIKGFEGLVSTFLDYDVLPTFAQAFGVEANVTYLDAKTGVPASLGGSITQTSIVGVSKWTYNLAGFYEHAGLSARLSWNHRSAFLSRIEPRGADVYSEHTKGIGRLDFSASYDLFKFLTLTADATNILGKPYRTTLTYDYANGDNSTFPRMIRYEESVYSLGVRFRF